MENSISSYKKETENSISSHHSFAEYYLHMAVMTSLSVSETGAAARTKGLLLENLLSFILL
jgi:hypothetical protein